MATYYFKVGTGEPFTDKVDAGDDAVAKGHAVKVTNAPDNVESWRMKYNFSTNSVDVQFDGDDEALAVGELVEVFLVLIGQRFGGVEHVQD